MDDIIGYISAIAFALMAVPQIVTIILTKSGSGTSWLFVIFNYIGNLCAIYYIASKDIISGDVHFPLYLNYGVATLNLIILSVLKFRYRRNDDRRRITT